MTNIGAIRVLPYEGSKHKEPFIVAVADSMSSSGREKEDNNQKLFLVGENILMGTGSRSIIYDAAAQLRTAETTTASGIAERLMTLAPDISRAQQINGEKFPTDFIVAGRNQNDFAVYDVRPFGRFTPESPTRVDPEERGIRENNSVFGGSGFTHVNTFFQGLQASGKGVAISDIATGLITMYDVGTHGARDAAVNDKLQYGIITPDKTAVLYDPHVQLDTDEVFRDYLHRITGITLPEMKPKRTEKEIAKDGQLRADMYSIPRQFYFQLSMDLADASGYRRSYTHTAELRADGFVRPAAVNAALKRRHESHANLSEGVDALLSGNLEQVLQYATHFAARQEERNERLRSLI